MNRRTAQIVVCCALLAATPSSAQERNELPPLRVFGAEHGLAQAGSLEAFVERYKSAWASQDAATFVSLHAGDTEWTNAYGRIFQGAEPLERFLATRLFPSFSAGTSQQEVERMRIVSLRYVGDGAGVVHLYTDSGRGQSANAGAALRRTHIHLMVARQDGDWRVVHTAIMDVRS